MNIEGKILDKKGFTLVEAIMAIVLFVILVIPLIYNFTYGLAYDAFMTDQIRALQLAKSKMEGYRAGSFSDIITTSEARGTIPEYGNYAVDTTVTSETATLKRVKVRVSYVRNSNNDYLELDTLITSGDD